MAEDRRETAPNMGVTERAVLGVLGAGLMLLGARGGRARKVSLAGTGGAMTVMALTGRNPLARALKIRPDGQGEIRVREAVTIGKPADEVYRMWRNLEGLPTFMEHLERVEVQDEQRSHWVAKGPVGPVSWDAEITADEPGQRLAWRSLPGSTIENQGEVQFRPAPGNRGTEVLAHFQYRAPGGTMGAILARMLSEEPSQQARDDLMRLKWLMELGFIPTAKGQSSGRAQHAGEARV
ncbi:SRPBCC family protein [Deinococcus sonorensis]|uniref:SRPBCC family protein n=2 Tax=Deinococcus sonorensis TaxID=309891 RepID=A0AAU7UG23_9DEIO